MATATVSYSSNTAITFDISSLGTSSTFLAGRESTEIDNTTNKYIDCLVNGDGITRHASTAPTVGQYIGLWVWGSDTSLATTPFDTLDGTDSAETLAHASVLNSLRFAGSAAVTVATAGLVYYIQPFSVASLVLRYPAQLENDGGVKIDPVDGIADDLFHFTKEQARFSIGLEWFKPDFNPVAARRDAAQVSYQLKR